jgi:hypothetical protein
MYGMKPEPEALLAVGAVAVTGAVRFASGFVAQCATQAAAGKTSHTVCHNANLLAPIQQYNGLAGKSVPRFV